MLHSFASPPKGANPNAGVIRDSAGNLYGTASSGGVANAGVVFKVDPAGHQNLLYNFTGGSDGGDPYARCHPGFGWQPLRDYPHGGKAGAGVVYKLDTTGAETVLYSFTGAADGGTPTLA